MASENIKERNRRVREIVAEFYEPGIQSRSKTWVYKNKVVRIYPMSERTFWRCLEEKKD